MSIDVKNIGPIEALSIPVPEHGGLVELRGPHGAGKSTALRAAQAALRGDGKLDLRDGADKGSVSLCGATIRVTRGRTSHGGELLVESLEGRFSLSDLIDPGLLDPERADAARIRALVELSGAKADVSLFRDLIGDEKIDAKADDLVGLAAKIKAALELKARDAEAAASNLHEKGTREAPPADAVLTGCRPAEGVAAELEAAVKALASLESQAKAAQAAHDKHEAARARLAAAGVAELEAAAIAARDRQAKAMAEAERLTIAANELREKLRQAESELQAATVAASSAVRESKAADAAVAAAKAIEGELSASLPPLVEASEIAAARARVDACREESDRQAVIRKHIDQAERASRHFLERDTFTARAKSLRERAAKVDDVLSEVVQRMGSPLRVRDGRLVLATDRGDELFGDLSHGERTLEAIDIGLSILPSGGVLVIDQETYGGLNGADKVSIKAKAEARNVLVLSAVITEDAELLAVVL